MSGHRLRGFHSDVPDTRSRLSITFDDKVIEARSDETVLAALVAEGFVRDELGSRGAMHCFVANPYRQTDDPEAVDNSIVAPPRPTSSDLVPTSSETKTFTSSDLVPSLLKGRGQRDEVEVGELVQPVDNSRPEIEDF